ncbi:MAG TPA: hypothetical protein PKD67_03135 [Ignavibacteriaceae bacterium]|nr:hypothetical protein [Ignavibacteriaceae bacterium]
MKYKNLTLAFLFEIVVGFGTILSISLLGYKGLAALAVLALRPFILEQEQIKDEKLYLQFSYKVLSNSLIIIFLMIVFEIIIIQFIPNWKAKLPPLENLLIIIIPFFLLTHGVIGYINTSILNK